MTPRTLGELARLVDGEVIGDDSILIRNISPLDDADHNCLSFVTHPRYRERALTTRAAALLVRETLDGVTCPQLRCANPYLAVATIATSLHLRRATRPGIAKDAWVHPEAVVDPSASVASGAVVEAEARLLPNCVVGATSVVGFGATVGEGAILHPGAKLLERCILGNRSILQAGAVVGSDGFGYAPDTDGRRTKIPQVGIVVIEDDVEIGANATIDRATFGQTVIGQGSKIDNLVQIAHNVKTGDNCIIVAQSGVAGSTTLGSRVVMGAQSGAVGHIRIGDGVSLAARAAAATDLESGAVYGGAPALPHRDWLRATVSFPQLPELRRKVRALERAIQELRDKLNGSFRES